MQFQFQEWLLAHQKAALINSLFKPQRLDECRYKKGAYGTLEDVRGSIKDHASKSKLRPGATEKDIAIITVEAIRHQLVDYDSCWRDVDRLRQQGKYEDVCEYLRAWHNVIQKTSELVTKLITRPDLFQDTWIEPLLHANEQWTQMKYSEKRLPPQCKDDEDDENWGRSLVQRAGPKPTAVKPPAKLPPKK